MNTQPGRHIDKRRGKTEGMKTQTYRWINGDTRRKANGYKQAGGQADR
jgi:hypothetical protein